MDLIAAAALLGASAISSATSIYNNKQNIKYAEEANEESIKLANTAHQREVRDLESAGLNPILSSSSSGASTPQLRTPNLESIDGNITHSASGIARALNGLTDAEVKQAQASAKSESEFADRAEELAAAEVSSAQAQNSLAHSQARVLELESYADRIEQLARIEALQGHRPGEVETLVGKWSGGKKVGMEVYNDLVQQFRNEIKTGRYRSSMLRAVGSDILSGASSASQIYQSTRRAKPATSRPIDIKVINNMKGTKKP